MNRIATLASIVLALVSVASTAPAGILPIDLAFGITPSVDGDPFNSKSALTDGTAFNQWDSTTATNTYAAVKFGSVKSFSRIIFTETPGYVTMDKVVQIANVTNPDAAIDSDWTTIQTYTGVASNGQRYYDLAGSYSSSGVRIMRTNASNQSPITPNVMRLNEIWVWDQLDGNIAKNADGYVGYGNSALNDELFDQQTYDGSLVVPLPAIAGYTWLAAQNITGAEIIGGVGTPTEVLKDVKLQYSVDGVTNWTDVPGTQVGSPGSPNTNKILNFNFTPIMAKGLRASTLSSDGDNRGRMTEFMVFAAPVPEPTSLAMIAVSGLMALRRRRAV